MLTLFPNLQFKIVTTIDFFLTIPKTKYTSFKINYEMKLRWLRIKNIKTV